MENEKKRQWQRVETGCLAKGVEEGLMGTYSTCLPVC